VLNSGFVLKIQPVDSKMRYQVDKLVRKAEAEPEYVDEQENPLSHRPNPGALVTKDQDPSATGGNDSDDNYPGGEIMGRGTSKARMGLAKLDVYHPPMMAAVPYSEDGDDGGEKQRRQQRRRRELLQRSEILETLQEEFGDAPLVTRSEARGAISDAAARKMREEDNLRHEFEENHMIRLVSIALLPFFLLPLPYFNKLTPNDSKQRAK
jgi:U3 small nucleolar ribonucleoprotein protein LCP5